MTAKEDKTNFISHYLEDWIPEIKQGETIERLNEVIESYCREQRHICQTEFDKDSYQDESGKFYVSCEDVLNAPMPEL